MSSSVTVEAAAGPFGLGEGPHWDSKTEKLYFVDIVNQKVCRLDPSTGGVTSVFIEHGPVGVAIPVDGKPDKFVVGSLRDFILITWDTEKNLTSCPIEKLASVDASFLDNRWNDGKVDSSGRFWGGTMGMEKDGKFPLEQGSLYSISGNLVPKKEVSRVTISNGLAWSLKDDIFYYIDSLTYQVVKYDYNSLTGEISNKRTVFDLKKNNVAGLPDGMTIDTDGNLWIAVYGGGSVLQVNPQTGKLMRSIDIPAKNVTSVAFGGPALDILYVTTASFGLSEKELTEQPQAGYVFAVKGLGVRGLPANSFKLNA